MEPGLLNHPRIRLDGRAVQKILLLLALVIFAVIASVAFFLHSSIGTLSMLHLNSRGSSLMQAFRSALTPALRHQKLSMELIERGVISPDRRQTLLQFFIPFLEENDVVTSLNIGYGNRSFMIFHEGEGRYRIREEVSGIAQYAMCNGQGLCHPDGAPVAYSYRESAWYAVASAKDSVSDWTDVYRFRTTEDPGITSVTGTRLASGEKLVLAYDLRLIELARFFQLVTPEEDLLPVLYFPDLKADLSDALDIRGLRYRTGAQEKGLFVMTVAHSENPAVLSLLADPEAAVRNSHGCRWWSDRVELSRERSPKIFLCLPEGELVRSIQIRSSTVLALAATLVLLTIGLSLLIVRQITSPYQEELENADLSLHSATRRLERREKELRHTMMKIQEELELARKTQLSIIPVVSRRYGPIQLTSRYVPASTLGGDFLDIYDLGEGLGFLMADVSGHGISSALITMMIKISSTLSREMLILPDVFLRHLNRSIFERTGMHFITALAGSIDYRDLKLKISNGGHCYPLLFRRSTKALQFIEANGICLGVLEEPAYETFEMELRAGDCVLFYTDGVVETMNESEELYGPSRLRRTLVENSHLSGNAMIDAILESLHRFARRDMREDDIAMILLEIPQDA